ncbi:MAG: membrane protein insertion efficiency factor YidD [Halobacteriovoraceae bacterium]|nr:membrane protein insertion efficiency factor YidD [Halobacteriovoraceae bacterium]
MKKSILALIKAYQYIISPLLGPRCRFTPSCSEYAKECFEKYGFWTACKKSFMRVSKCHPFHPGGHDPS